MTSASRDQPPDVSGFAAYVTRERHEGKAFSEQRKALDRLVAEYEHVSGRDGHAPSVCHRSRCDLVRE